MGNTSDSYGLLSPVLHWVMAVAILGMLAPGTMIEWTQSTLLNLWLSGFHKSAGLCLFGPPGRLAQARPEAGSKPCKVER